MNQSLAAIDHGNIISISYRSARIVLDLYGYIAQSKLSRETLLVSYISDGRYLEARKFSKILGKMNAVATSLKRNAPSIFLSLNISGEGYGV